jgi:hypothetical protein
MRDTKMTIGIWSATEKKIIPKLYSKIKLSNTLSNQDFNNTHLTKMNLKCYGRTDKLSEYAHSVFS